MNIMIIGSGGRESALAWTVSRSRHTDNLYIIPGNGGTLKYGDNIHVKVEPPFTDVINFAEDADIDLTIVGPEAPLVNGIVDEFQGRGLRIFGPSSNAAQLEGSKAYMKNFMEKYHIPTADYQIFSNPHDAFDYVNRENKAFVVKTDGLAAGKGAIINQTIHDTINAINRLMIDHEFGRAGNTIVVEELMEGPEISVFIVSDGKNFKWLGSAQDHKRVFDNDEGPNTGGMGAYAPAPFVDSSLKERIINEAVIPTLDGMRAEGRPYTGILYFGFMLTKHGPKILEYNVRFGDPEAQVILPLLKSDFVELSEAVLHGNLSNTEVVLNTGFCAGVVMASEGYPGTYPKGRAISGQLNDENRCFVFHAGTGHDRDGSLITTGGRVLCVSALGESLQDAIDRAYDKVGRIHFEGAHYRKDIGQKGISWYKNRK